MPGYFPGDTWPPDLASLSAEQQASFWVGCVVREDVGMENSLRQVFETLARPGLGTHVAPLDFGGLSSGTLKMLRGGAHMIPAGVLATSEGIVQAAIAVHKRRNRVAHDYWYQSGAEDTPTGFSRMRNAVSLPPDPQPIRRDLNYFRACHEDLCRVNFRLTWLHLELTRHVDFWHEPTRGLREPIMPMPQLTKLLAGDFTLVTPGEVRFD